MKEDRFGPMVSEASVQSVESIVSGAVRRQKHQQECSGRELIISRQHGRGGKRGEEGEGRGRVRRREDGRREKKIKKRWKGG